MLGADMKLVVILGILHVAAVVVEPLFYEKAPLERSQEARENLSWLASYLPAFAVGISTFPRFRGLLQLQRAVPSTAPDKRIFNL
jgi:hypothetical protein